MWTGDACDKKSCEGDCGQGKCGASGECECEAGYFGKNCEMSTCTDECSFRGRCVESDDGSTCECDDGFEGEACQIRNLKNCSGHGSIENDECVCDPVKEDPLFPGQMWEGAICSEKQTRDPECPLGCGTHGKCVEENRCECDLGWSGIACGERACHSCSNHGKCHEDTYCICDQGYTGPECSVKLCGAHNCSGNGECIDGSCLCNPGFSGEACDIELACGVSQCHNHGQCIKKGDEFACECFPSFTGANCESRGCPSSNGAKCSGHGVCNDEYQCQCDEGYTSPDCSHIECDSCLNGATCSPEGQCICAPGFMGKSCELKACDGGCNGNGICDTSTGSCHCQVGFGGSDCSERVCVGDCNGFECKELTNGEGHMCKCGDDHFGLGCENKTCSAHHDCSPPNGVCSDGVCFCREGFGSSDCSKKLDCGGCQNGAKCDVLTQKCECTCSVFLAGKITTNSHTPNTQVLKVFRESVVRRRRHVPLEITERLALVKNEEPATRRR